jgi:integrase
VRLFFWCEARELFLDKLNPVIVAAYIEHLGTHVSTPTVKQALAAIRMLCDYLVLGHALEMNPATSVRGPRYVIKKGKTPVLTADETRQLLDVIPTDTVIGLRDRALIGVMVYSFARVGAVVRMKVEDFYENGRRHWFRLHEKGGKFHEVPAHHRADDYLHAYIATAGIADDKKSPLFRTVDRHRHLTQTRIDPNDVLRMIRRYARRAGLSQRIGCHTFRATGITAYLQNGGTLEKAAQIAAHESTRTTQLYNRTNDAVSLDEIERIVI